jgi:serine/threonine protein kinase
MPYSEDKKSDLYRKIQHSSPRFPSELDKQSQDFLCLFLVKNPQQRATFNSTKKHPFWNGLNFNDILERKLSPQFIPDSSYSAEEKCQKYFFHNDKENEIETEDHNPKLIYPIMNRFSFALNKN